MRSEKRKQGSGTVFFTRAKGGSAAPGTAAGDASANQAANPRPHANCRKNKHGKP